MGASEGKRRLLVLIIFCLMGGIFCDQCTKFKNCKCDTLATGAMTVNCSFGREENATVDITTLPPDTHVLAMKGGSLAEFAANAFMNQGHLRRVIVEDFHTIVFSGGSYVPIEYTNHRLHLDLMDSQRLYIKNNALRKIKTTLVLRVENFFEVDIGTSAFATLGEMHVHNVVDLKLAVGSFHDDSNRKVQYRHGPVLIVRLSNVGLEEVPEHAFPTSFAVLQFEKVQIKHIRRDSFSGMQFSALKFDDCKITSIDHGAFAAKSHIVHLKIANSVIDNVEGGAIASGIDDFQIINNTMRHIFTDAINTSSAKVLIQNNTFDIIKTEGFTLRGWDTLTVVGNDFVNMENLAIVTEPLAQYDMTFKQNNMTNAQPGSLKFVALLKSANYEDNFFNIFCNCSDKNLTKAVFGTANYNHEHTSCKVDEHTQKCFNFTVNVMTMQRFFENSCSNISGCALMGPEDSVPSHAIDSFFSTKGANAYLMVVFSFAGVLFVGIVAYVFLYLAKKKLRKFSAAAIMSGLIALRPLNIELNGVSAATVNNTLLDTAETALGPTDLSNELYEIPIYTTDKATQSLPEELTEELLDCLKKKLDDPATYEEARETINHLYKMIIVEENCNSNVTKEEEHIYDLPIPPVADTHLRRNRSPKRTISVGTRAPSLDKLLPVSPYDRAGALCREYFEPLDLAAHIYAEISNYQRKGLSSVPDVLAQQPVPRGPFLRALLHKNGISAVLVPTVDSSTIGSDKSSTSSMLYRPLPPKPRVIDSGEGTSTALKV